MPSKTRGAETSLEMAQPGLVQLQLRPHLFLVPHELPDKARGVRIPDVGEGFHGELEALGKARDFPLVLENGANLKSDIVAGEPLQLNLWEYSFRALQADSEFKSIVLLW